MEDNNKQKDYESFEKRQAKRQSIPAPTNFDDEGNERDVYGQEDPDANAKKQEDEEENNNASYDFRDDNEYDEQAIEEESGADADVEQKTKKESATKEKVMKNLRDNKAMGDQGKKHLIRKILGKVKDAIVKLIASHPIIAIIIIGLFIIVALLVKAFWISSDDENSYRKSFAIQDLANGEFYENRQEDMEMYQNLTAELELALTGEDMLEFKDELLEYSSEITGYDDAMISAYDKEAGYQILNQEGTVLVLLEQLSYAHNFTDWEPNYDVGGKKEEYYLELKADVEAHKENQGDWSAMKLQDKKKELRQVEQEYTELDFEVQRYEELNKKYKKKIDEEFVNSSKKAKEHPDGTPVEKEVVEYFKDRYGVETEEIKEELTYFHTIMERNMTYRKKITSNDTTALKKFLEKPKFQKSELQVEDDKGIDLAWVEKPFRARFEIMHHETILDLINNDKIKNSVFEEAETVKKLKKTLSNHMPLFEYATYDDKVVDKTFYDYELYDEDYFTADGRYVYDASFNTKILKYTDAKSTDIDFSVVEEQQRNEYQLEQYEKKLEETDDAVLREELEELIAELEEKIAENPSSSALMYRYKKNFQKVMDMTVKLDNESRPYDPHNHNILLDDAGEYYINYGEIPLDKYKELTEITETLTHNANLGANAPANTKVTYSSWVTAPDQDEESAQRKVESVTTTQMVQSSLKPTKIRSLMNSADFGYIKTEEREIDVDPLIEEARKASHWEMRDVFFDGKSVGKQYQKVSTCELLNYGQVDGSVTPWDTNTNMQLDSSTYLVDFYGQAELLTDEYVEETPGTLGDGPRTLSDVDKNYNDAERTIEQYEPGHANIKYYNQADYPGEKYGKSTLKRSGCGPTCFAMVISSLTNVNMTPVDAARWAEDNGYCSGTASYRSLFSKGPKAFGLEVNPISRHDKKGVIAALEAGHPVVLICGPGNFTKGGHFIVLTGIDEYGYVTVNDPASRTRTGMTWTIERIMMNASQASDDYTFWEIY